MSTTPGTDIDLHIGKKDASGTAPWVVWSSANHSIQEDSTPVDPADSTGGYGQISATILDHKDARAFRDEPLELVDGEQGTTVGIIRGLAKSKLGLTLTADSRLAQLAVTRQAQPFVGTLGGALRYYLSLCGLTTGIVVADSLENVPVKLLGWKANVYEQIKKLGPAHSFEVSLVSNNVVFRPLRGRVAENYRDADVSWAIDATNLAQKVEGWGYTITAGQDLAYPIGGWSDDVNVYIVEAGQSTEVELPIDASLSSVIQPTCVAFVDRYLTSASVYSVSGNDGIAIPPAQWEAGGGRVLVEIGEDTRSLKVTITGSTETAYAPYRIAVSAGTSDWYSSLRIRGTGTFFTRELMSLPACLDPDRAPNEIGVTVDNEFYETPDELFHGLMWSASRFSMPLMTIDVTSKAINRRGDTGSAVYPTIGDVETRFGAATIATRYTQLGPTIADWNATLFELVQDSFENQAFGNVGGARVVHDFCWYRIRSATINRARITYQGEWDNTIGDVYHHGETIAQWNARWAGKTIREVNEVPLQGLSL